MGKKGTFTEDSDATANDIMKDKTAYVKGQKIVGVHEELNTSDATATVNDIISPKTAYVNGKKITGVIGTTYEVDEAILNYADTIVSTISGSAIIYDKYFIGKDDININIYKMENGVISDLILNIPLSSITTDTDAGVICDVDMAEVPIPNTNEQYYMGITTCKNYFNERKHQFTFILKVDLMRGELMAVKQYYYTDRGRGNNNLSSGTIKFLQKSYNRFINIQPITKDYTHLEPRFCFAEIDDNNLTITTKYTFTRIYEMEGTRWTDPCPYYFEIQQTNNIFMIQTFLKATSPIHAIVCQINWDFQTMVFLLETSDKVVCLLDDGIISNDIYYAFEELESDGHTLIGFDYDVRHGIVKYYDGYILSFCPVSRFVKIYSWDSAEKSIILIRNEEYPVNTSIYQYNQKLGIPNSNSYGIYYADNLDKTQIRVLLSNVTSQKLVAISKEDTIFVDTSNATASSYNLLKNTSAYIKGEKIIGSMPNNGTLAYTPKTTTQTIPKGYTEGGTIEAVTSSIDPNLIAENIKAGVTILGVTGTYTAT